MKHDKCEYPKCDVRPSFNFAGETKGKFCIAHKKENMINVADKTCEHPSCRKIPAFNEPGKTGGRYCFDHKGITMVNVMSKLCAKPGCSTQPSFNLPTEKVGLFCFAHKTDAMIEVVSKKCEQENCNSRAYYNNELGITPKYCLIHKSENMKNVVTKRCIDKNCDKHPGYNFSHETKPIYCADHKLKGMIDVNSKFCCEKKCKNDAVFGYIGKRKQCCEEHKKSEMVNLDIEYKCSECEKEYDFIVDNKKFCMEHCPNKDYEIKIKKMCKICDIEEKSNFICNDCKQLANKKEWAVVRYIKKNIDTPHKHNSNEPVKECSNRRPDVIFELPTHCVIVEIDENQHKAYQESCECARINEIVNSIGGKSVVFIRYNPDKTYNTHKKKKEIKFEIEDKLKLLIKTIKKELVKEYDEICVKLIQLYYDDDYEEYKKQKVEYITDKVMV
jgi:hypothetical protein